MNIVQDKERRSHPLVSALETTLVDPQDEVRRALAIIIAEVFDLMFDEADHLRDDVSGRRPFEFLEAERVRRKVVQNE